MATRLKQIDFVLREPISNSSLSDYKFPSAKRTHLAIAVLKQLSNLWARLNPLPQQQSCRSSSLLHFGAQTWRRVHRGCHFPFTLGASLI
jgi:hypothetical protein